MADQTSTADVVAAVLLAIALFGSSLVPFFLFVNVEHLTPRVLRDPEARERAALTVLNARDWARLAAVDALLGLVLLLNSPKGATR